MSLNQKIRVAIVAQFPPPPAGMALQAEYLARRLEADGAEVVPIDTVAGGKRRPRWPRYYKFFREIGKIKGADLVVLTAGVYAGFFTFTISTLFAAKFYKVPVIIQVKSGLTEGFLERFAFIVKPLLKLGAAVWVPGLYQHAVLKRRGVDSKIIPDFIDRAAISAAGGRATDRPVLLLARHLYPIYRVDHAIKAFAIVREKYQDAELHVAGDGEERTRLERLAAEVTTGGVYFYGWLDREGLNGLFEKASFLINTNLVDNYPNTIIEAMCAGLPVISYDVGGVPYLVDDGVTGFLVPSGDIKKMAATVIRAYENPELRAKVVSAAKAKADDLFWPPSKPGFIDYLLPYIDNDRRNP